MRYGSLGSCGLAFSLLAFGSSALAQSGLREGKEPAVAATPPAAVAVSPAPAAPPTAPASVSLATPGAATVQPSAAAPQPSAAAPQPSAAAPPIVPASPAPAVAATDPAAAASATAPSAAPPAAAVAPAPTAPAPVLAPAIRPPRLSRATLGWDVNLEGAYGRYFPEKEGFGFGRVRAGLLYSVDPVFYALGLTYEWSNLEAATFGVQGEVMQIEAGIWAQLGAVIDAHAHPGANASVGWSVLGAEIQYRKFDPGDYGFAALGKIRIPVTFIAKALQ